MRTAKFVLEGRLNFDGPEHFDYLDLPRDLLPIRPDDPREPQNPLVRIVVELLPPGYKLAEPPVPSNEEELEKEMAAIAAAIDEADKRWDFS